MWVEPGRAAGKRRSRQNPSYVSPGPARRRGGAEATVWGRPRLYPRTLCFVRPRKFRFCKIDPRKGITVDTWRRISHAEPRWAQVAAPTGSLTSSIAAPNIPSECEAARGRTRLPSLNYAAEPPAALEVMHPMSNITAAVANYYLNSTRLVTCDTLLQYWAPCARHYSTLTHDIT